MRCSIPQRRSKWRETIATPLRQMLNGSDFAFVHYAQWDEDAVRKLTVWLAQCGIPNFFANREVVGPWLVEAVRGDSSIAAFLHDEVVSALDPAGKEPVACLLGSRTGKWWPRIWSQLGEGRGMCPAVLIGPASTEHPERQGRRLLELENRPCLSIGEWEEHYLA